METATVLLLLADSEAEAAFEAQRLDPEAPARGLPLAAVALVDAADGVLRRRTWLRYKHRRRGQLGAREHFIDALHSGWKVFAVLGAMQRRYFGVGMCLDGYAMRTLTLPPTWICDNIPHVTAEGSSGHMVYGAEIWSSGFYSDCEHLRMLLEATRVLTRRRCTLLDVGAHVGVCSVLAAAGGFNVVAVEAEPQNMRRLQIHRRLNGAGVRHRLRLVHAAVGAKRGEVRLLSVVGNRALSLVMPAGRRVNETVRALSPWEPLTLGDVRESVVPSETIDGILEAEGLPLGDEGQGGMTHEGCYVLKLDVEGAEVAALSGASRLLRSGRLMAYLVEQNNALLRLNNQTAKSLRLALQPANLVLREVLDWDGLEERCKGLSSDMSCVLNLAGVHPSLSFGWRR